MSNNSALNVVQNPLILQLREHRKLKMEGEGENFQESSQNCRRPFLNLNTGKQIETRLADGRRRITPLFIPPPDIAPISSRSLPTFSSSSEKKSHIIIEKRGESCLHAPSRLETSTTKYLFPTVTSSMTTASSSPFVVTSIKTSDIPSESKCMPIILSSSIELKTEISTKALKKKLVSNLNSSAPEVHQQNDEMPKELSISTPVAKTKESSLPFKSQSPNVAHVRTSQKRKSGAHFPRKTEKKKHSRPPLFQSQQQTPKSVPEKTLPEKIITTLDKAVSLSSDLRLPRLEVDKSSNVFIYHEEASRIPVYLEIENNISVGFDAVIHKLKCFSGTTLKWEIGLNSKGAAVAGSAVIICVVCDDKTLSIFSKNGRRVYSPIVLTSHVTRLSCSDKYAMAITTKGYMSVWDCSKLCCLMQNESLYPIMQDDDTGDLSVRDAGLNDNGIPMVSLSNGKSYVFSRDMQAWLRMSSQNDALQLCSDLQLRFPPEDLSNGTILPLATLQGQNQENTTRLARSIMSSNPTLRQIGTLSYLDNQLAASLNLKSSKEYKFWLFSLVRYLVQEGLEVKLRDLCDGLLEPVVKSARSLKWKPNILEIPKKDLLQEVLLIVGSNLRFQRLYIEYRDQLDGVK